MMSVGIRKSDEIFNSLNRLNIAKQTGGLDDTELSNLIVSIGDVFANKVKQGKVSEDEIESACIHLSGFEGKNGDKYFAFPHKDLDRASKSFIEGVYMAKDEADKRAEYSQPVMEAESYERTFRKLG